MRIRQHSMPRRPRSCVHICQQIYFHLGRRSSCHPSAVGGEGGWGRRRRKRRTPNILFALVVEHRIPQVCVLHHLISFIRHIRRTAYRQGYVDGPMPVLILTQMIQRDPVRRRKVVAPAAARDHGILVAVGRDSALRRGRRRDGRRPGCSAGCRWRGACGPTRGCGRGRSARREHAVSLLSPEVCAVGCLSNLASEH
jgi:hypothetical protein